MRQFLILAGLCALGLSVFAQGTWVQKANFGGTPRYGASSFVIGGFAYTGLGYDGSNYCSDLWQYDPINNQWTQKASLIASGRHGASAFEINGKGYISTGLNGSTRFNDCWEYDPILNSWTSKSNFPGVARYDATGLAIGNKGYVGLGTWGPSGPMYNDFYEFDPVANTWIQRANFPGAQRNGTRGFSIGQLGYVGLGSNVTQNICYNDFYAFDPVSNTWIQKANFPGTARAGYSAFALCNNGFIGAGAYYSSMSCYNDFWQYIVATNSWVQLASISGSPRGWTIGFSVGTKGYIGLGYDGNYFGDLWEYTPNGSIVTTITSSATSICSGQNVTLTAQGGTNYSWSNGNSTSAIVVSPINSSTYSVIATDQCGIDTAYINITVVPLALDPGFDMTICKGDTVILSGGGNATSYTWSPAISLSNPYSGAPQAFPSVTTTYTVIGSNSLGCSATDYQSIFVNPPAATPTITINGNLLVSSIANSYLWYFNGNPLLGDTLQSLLISQSGIYLVQTTDSNGCFSMSLPVNVIFNSTGITNNYDFIYLEYQAKNNQFLLYVPSDRVVTELAVYNSFGQLVDRLKFINGQTLSIHAPWPVGVYHFVLNSEGEIRAIKGFLSR